MFRVEIAPAEWSAAGADAWSFWSRRTWARSRGRSKRSRPAARSRASRWRSRPAWRGAEERHGRTLVFDEVDAGVGGSAAEGVGRRLKKLAAANQVLCVTHLPQIAASPTITTAWRSTESERPHRRGDRRTGRRGAHPRDRPHALGPEAHAGSAEARRATDQNERRLTDVSATRECRPGARQRASARGGRACPCRAEEASMR